MEGKTENRVVHYLKVMENKDINGEHRDDKGILIHLQEM